MVPRGDDGALHDPELHRKLCLAGAQDVEASEVCERMGLLCRELELDQASERSSILQRNMYSLTASARLRGSPCQRFRG